jgi:hypothetical protein
MLVGWWVVVWLVARLARGGGVGIARWICVLTATLAAALTFSHPVAEAAPEGYASEAWSEIISKAAVSPLGIIALVVLVTGFVVMTLVPRRSSTGARVLVVVLLLLFFGGLVVAAIYTVRPTTLPAAAAKGAEGEGPAHQPPVAPKPQEPPSAPPAAPQPPVAQAPTRTDCGTAWTGWVNAGGGVGNPCPAGCERGAELGQSYRAVGFPPRPQAKHKFQCWRNP